MFKLTAILVLMFIDEVQASVTFGLTPTSSLSFDNMIIKCSTLLAASMSCNSCGSECTPACGTRHFRTCCFNYLRRKRGPDMMQAAFENLLNRRPESKQFTEGYEILAYTPSGYELHQKDDRKDNVLHNIFM